MAVRLPSSADVETVSPRVTSDAGAVAPAGAFESPLGVAIQELEPATEKLAQVALRQENRRDTVDRSSKINQYNREAEEELRRLNSEADLSDEQILTSYGDFLSQKRQELIQGHEGSDDSRARLTVRLQDVESASQGRASAISTSIGREKVLTTFDDALDPLITQAAQDPSRATIDRLFSQDLPTVIDDLKGAFDPSEEENIRKTGREQIALSAFNTLIARGDIETASSLLDEGGLTGAISAETRRDIRGRIETTRAARDEFTTKIVQAEAARGQRFSPQERIQFVDALFGVGGQEDLVEIGDPDSPTGTRFVPQSQAVGQPGPPGRPLVNISQPQIGTIPPGFQVVRDPSDENILRMEPIPGGPADAASKQRVKQQADAARLTGRQAKLVVRDVDRSLAIIEQSALPAVGPFAGTVALPGTPAFQLERQLDGIKARIGFDQLQAMRAASPTGGALGQVSERENILLQSVLGSLDIRQDRPIIEENLKQIRELYLDAWFGTPEEHEAAVEEGRMTPEQVTAIVKERETVGFDAIGRALDPQPETTRQPRKGEKPATAKQPAETQEVVAEDILAMSLGELQQLDVNTLDEAELTALEQRMTELGR